MQNRELPGDIIGILGEDVMEAYSTLQNRDSQYGRRAYLRAWAASVEGLCFAFKQTVLRRHECNLVKLTRGDLALLEEEEYGQEKDGSVKISMSRLKTLPNILYSLRAISQAIGSTRTKPDTSLHGWESFQQAFRMRDRTMHPKTKESLCISDDEMKTLSEAAQWFVDEITAILTSSPMGDSELAAKLKQSSGWPLQRSTDNRQS